MYKQERVVGGRLGADSADVEEWCGVFLEDLEGLDAPGVERSPATPGGEMGQYGTRSLDEAHPLDDAREPFHAEPHDVLGKRGRTPPAESMGLGIMSQRDLHASQPGLPPHGGLMAPSPPPGGTGSGPSSARAPGASHAMHHGGTHERALALGMGPYRSSSVHSVESTLSNAIDHSIDDEGEPYGMDGLLRRASPPHKKGPLSLPPGAPTLGGGRRAFSEGALGADHLGWGQQLGGSGLAGSPFEPHDEELQDDDATEPPSWGGGLDGEGDADADEPSGQRSAQKTAPWTRTEDQVISEAVKRFGCKWGVLSALLPGRTDNAVRNRWHRLERARKWREESAKVRGAAEPTAAAAAPEALLPPGARNGSGGYKCGRCGQPKRGHLCTVMLEADQHVYDAAQDKMRQLHLQQVEKRPSSGSRRKQPASSKGGGGGAHAEPPPLPPPSSSAAMGVPFPQQHAYAQGGSGYRQQPRQPGAPAAAAQSYARAPPPVQGFALGGSGGGVPLALGVPQQHGQPSGAQQHGAPPHGRASPHQQPPGQPQGGRVYGGSARAERSAKGGRAHAQQQYDDAPHGGGGGGGGRAPPDAYGAPGYALPPPPAGAADYPDPILPAATEAELMSIQQAELMQLLGEVHADVTGAAFHPMDDGQLTPLAEAADEGGEYTHHQAAHGGAYAGSAPLPQEAPPLDRAMSAPAGQHFLPPHSVKDQRAAHSRKGKAPAQDPQLPAFTRLKDEEQPQPGERDADVSPTATAA